MDLDEDGVSKDFFLRSYDPVTVAASIHLRLPFNMIQSTSIQNSAFNRRRLSLIEALNNSIQDDFCSPTDHNSNKDEMSKTAIMKSAEPQRIYSVRQILAQNYEHIDRGRMSMRVPRIYVKNIRDESAVQEVPRIVRARTTKRSKSQPNNSNSSQDSDTDYDSAIYSNVSRVECDTPWQRGCRCSLQSTTSSMESRSISSGDSGVVLAEASWDHVAVLPDELPFASGDVITVLDSSSQTGLWYGSCRDSQGWFPASHVTIVSNPLISRPTSTCNSTEWDPSLRVRRGKIVEELLHTERDYVRLLEDIVQGFLEQTRRRNELFSPNRIRNIFGNIHSIYLIHAKLLRDLEMSFDQNNPENTIVGSAFLRNKQSFTIYSEYCNNRPVSCAELAQLSRQGIYRQFFEACRLLRGMPNLSLEGFLLTPVQRICRYPLQLAELLKATPPWHDDYCSLETAEKSMRDVTRNINDRKRRVEGLQDIVRWQRRVHGWRGPDLLETNSAMLHSGEVYIRYMINGQQQWAKDVLLFLFDQSIVICKKDLLKKNFFIFKERMSLQSIEMRDVKDGKDSSFGVSVKNSFKLTGNGRQYLISCPDKKSKAAWKASFDFRENHLSTATAEEKRLALATIHSMEFI